MDEYIAMLGPWTWWIIGVLLLIGELLAPGVFLIWLGLAALCVGVIDSFLFDMSWHIEVTLFGALSLILLVAGRPFVRRRQDIVTDQPNLNRRVYNYVGQTYLLQKDIVSGRGKLSIDDTLWDVRGPDLRAGTQVKVTGVEGQVLQVEAASTEAGQAT